MSVKGIFVLCAQALFIQVALSQCAGLSNLGVGLASCGLSSPILPSIGGCGCAGNGLPSPGCSGLGNYGNGLGFGAGLGYGSGLGIDVIPTYGGSFIVTSSSPIAPTGLSIVSEDAFEGNLYVVGELPFVGAADLDGVVASGGAGAVNYVCGNGVVAAESAGPAAGYGTVGAVAPLYIAAGGCNGLGLGGYGPDVIAPLPLGVGGCNGAGIAPVEGIVAPACGCYPPGIYY